MESWAVIWSVNYDFCSINLRLHKSSRYACARIKLDKVNTIDRWYSVPYRKSPRVTLTISSHSIKYFLSSGNKTSIETVASLETQRISRLWSPNIWVTLYFSVDSLDKYLCSSSQYSFFFVSPPPNKKNLEKTNYLDSPVIFCRKSNS